MIGLNVMSFAHRPLINMSKKERNQRLNIRAFFFLRVRSLGPRYLKYIPGYRSLIKPLNRDTLDNYHYFSVRVGEGKVEIGGKLPYLTWLENFFSGLKKSNAVSSPTIFHIYIYLSYPS